MKKLIMGLLVSAVLFSCTLDSPKRALVVHTYKVDYAENDKGLIGGEIVIPENVRLSLYEGCVYWDTSLVYCGVKNLYWQRTDSLQSAPLGSSARTTLEYLLKDE